MSINLKQFHRMNDEYVLGIEEEKQNNSVFDKDITNIEFDGVDIKDYPDFSDAYIIDCLVDSISASDEELEEINDNSQFVYNELMKKLF